MLALAISGTSVVAVAPEAMGARLQEPSEALGDLDPSEWDESAGPEPTPWEESPIVEASPPEEGQPPPAVEAELPEAGEWEVSLTDPGSFGEIVGDDEQAGPVEVGVAEKRADGRAVSRSVANRARDKDVSLTVHDRSVAERAGVTGFVFEVDGDGSRESAGAMIDSGEVPLEMSLDYSGLAKGSGPEFGSRLQVVALPACVLEDPLPPGCSTTGVPVSSRNDLEGQQLVVDQADLARLGERVTEANRALQALPADASSGYLAAMAAGAQDVAESEARALEDAAPVAGLEAWGSSVDAPAVVGPAAPAAPGGSAARSEAGTATVFAVTAAGSSDLGTYEATGMSVSGEWDVSAGSGEFGYSYPINVPAPPGGQAPTVGIGYSSGAVDGFTHSSNPQSSQTGLGWSDFANAFIERSYESCAEAEVMPEALWGNLCFKNYNATISLGGVSGRLIPIDTNYTQWRLQGDPGWKIERTAMPDPGQKNYRTAENWKVTGPDGTQYFFGLHSGNPDASATTNSVWWVPVTSDHAGEPCWNTTNNFWDGCNMAYRWMLDRVVDPDGNLATYYYGRETNNFRAWPGVAPKVGYIRSGYLTRIEYGGRAGAGPTQKPAVRVSFDVQNRCWYLVAACGAATSKNASAFFDVPTNLICDTQTECPHGTPTFFSTKRYSAVRTEVLVGTAYKLVSQYNLAGRAAKFSDENGDADWMMYLDWVQQVGNATTTPKPAYPKTTFEYGYLHNFVAARPTTATRIWRARLTTINNPFGGQIKVTYSTDNCPATYQPPAVPGTSEPDWGRNDKPCFPQLYKSRKDNITRHGIFHKYRVLKVEELPRFGADTMVTQYAYTGGAGWAHKRGMSDNDQVRWGWTVWRGYGEVTVTKGTAASGYSRTQLRLFRGLYDDLQITADNCVCGRRGAAANPKYFDGSTGADDRWWMAGRVLEERQVTSALNPLTSTRYTYVKSDLIDPALPNEEFRPTWAAVADVTERVWSTSTQFVERGTSTTYNANFQPATTVEKGWLHIPGDDRCSVTTYADNPAKGMFNFPAVNETRAGSCTTGQVLSRSETYYDLSTTLGAAPSRGNATWTRSRIDGTRWSGTHAGYDNLGRTTSMTDAAGATTTTAYTPNASVSPTKIEVTNHLQHKSSTELDPVFGTPLKATDPNGNVTTWKYDTLGRTTEIRRPSEQTTANPSLAFSYTLDEDDAGDPDFLPEKPGVVKTRQLQIYSGSGGVFEDVWIFYDGFMRERQSQMASPEPGKVLVGESRYDARGMVREEIVPEPMTGTPGAGLLSPSTWLNRTRYVYDELGRATHSQWMTPGSATAVESQTVTTYGTDIVTVEGPDGGMVRETTDGLGRTVKVEEKDGSNWVATNYVYDLADNLTKVVDPAGNETTSTHNMAGWRTSQTDPDRGAARFEYDVAGRQTMAEDASGQQIHTTYDLSGRPTERRADNPTTGALLASWTYDTVKLGLPTSTTRHTAGGDWTTTVNTYDDKNRAASTTLTVPAGIPGLSGSYTVGQRWDRADHPYETTLPAVGGLPAETLRTGHNGFGLPATLTGAENYVWATGYDGRARPTATLVGPANPDHGYGIGIGHFVEYNQQQQVQRTYTMNTWSAHPDGTVAEHKPAFRKDGLVTHRDSSLDGQSWRECYGYDNRARLTSTYTVAHGTACTEANKGGGDQPFERSYRYSVDGKLEERREDGTPTAYTYPTGGVGSVRPHAPSQIGGRDYTWNADGSLDTREVDGGTETFTWDIEHLLSSIDGSSGTTGFVYDASGQRLLRTNPDGTKTLYFAGHEVTANAAGSSVTAVRSYSHNGRLIATRSVTGVDYLVSDNAGSVEGSMASGAATMASSRRYDPYGQVRSEAGADLATERGFLGQVEDSTTNLSYLNARYYDAEAGLFVSADPLFDTSKPKSLNPYTYGLGNPVSFSDPSGLASGSLWSTEVENNALRGHIKALQGIITQMGAHIAELQSIIRQQQKAIQDLIAENNALRSVIAQQQAVIRQLAARVVYLEGRVAYWRGQALYWKGKALYYRTVIKDLVGIAYRPQFRDAVLSSIWSGRGVPSHLWLGSYAALSIHLQSELQRLGRERGFNTFRAREMGTTTFWNLKSMPEAWQQRFDKYWNAQTGRADLPIEYETRIPFKYERGATVPSYGAPANVWEQHPDYGMPAFGLSELCTALGIGRGGVAAWKLAGKNVVPGVNVASNITSAGCAAYTIWGAVSD